MKRTMMFLCGMLSILHFVHAQDKAFEKGNNLVNVGVGIGGSYNGFGSSIPLTASYERAVSDELGIGAQVSYASASFAEGYKVSATLVAARGAYHFGDMIGLPAKVDLYGGALLGYVIAKVSTGGYSASATSGLGYAFFGGGKYYFSPSVAAFAEIGIQSLGALNAGIAFKF